MFTKCHRGIIQFIKYIHTIIYTYIRGIYTHRRVYLNIKQTKWNYLFIAINIETKRFNKPKLFGQRKAELK